MVARLGLPGRPPDRARPVGDRGLLGQRRDGPGHVARPARGGTTRPQDVSVVGFDDLIAEYMWPPLTTVSQDFAATGRELVAALLGLIAAPETTPISRTLVPTRLVVRASTGPAPTA
nr:substrate-binding domain-containing protein [Brooklawnia cerclae]